MIRRARQKIIVLLLGVTVVVPGLAKDLGQIGTVYPVAEPDLLQVIQHKLEMMRDSGQLATLQHTMTQNLRQTVNEPTAVQNLKTATQRRQRLFDPSIILTKTFYAPNGEVIAKAGQSINPLDTVSLTKPLIFFDARSYVQQRWALHRFHALHDNAMLILTGGRVLDLMKKWQMPLYFDQGGQLTTRLHITVVPAMVVQREHQLQITEEPAV